MSSAWWVVFHIQADGTVAVVGPFRSQRAAEAVEADLRTEGHGESGEDLRAIQVIRPEEYLL